MNQRKKGMKKNKIRGKGGREVYENGNDEKGKESRERNIKNGIK